MIGGILKKIVGSSNDRVLRSMNATLLKIGDLEKTVAPLSDTDLSARTAAFKVRIENGEPLDSILPEAFATVREASKRVLGMRHFDMQIIGGMVLHQGKIAEMRTGEGKTLVATLPAYLNALSGKGVHVVTVNDYLAQRDADWMGRLYRFLGLEVGVVFNRMPEEAKKKAYQADITYGQNNEIGFDYLRDNMKFSIDEMVQRGHNFAIVDEVDSILVDEARTPLIISGPAEDSSQNYYRANTIVPQLQKDEHYEVDLRANSVSLNEVGIAKAEELLGVKNLYDPHEIELLHCLNQSLHAHVCKERDVDYLVNNGQVIIVDEFTGRAMPGRRWSDGLHQAIEAKEGLAIARESQTLASITFQNLFRLYNKLSGMTGTAATEALEFKEIYNLDVVVIPTHRSVVRQDQSDLVFRSKREKYNAVCDDLVEIHKSGQPALVGTISIEQSEFISKELTERNIPHQVLNAKQHEREALVVAQAGRLGAVTIATNMAGRGTDIVLGGNPEGLAKEESGTNDEHAPAYQEALKKYREICSAEREQVVAAGGLFIMGTERHESRRIDNQLRGRSGRQGDPGCSRFYVSFEDDLMKRFHGERLQALTNRIGWEEGAALDGRLVSRSIESAQTKVERYHFEARKNVTEYDDVMNKQRQVVYNLRSRILAQDHLRDEILSMMEDLVEESVLTICQARQRSSQWDLEKLKERFLFLCNSECSIDPDASTNAQGIFDSLRTQAKERFLAHVSEQQAILDELREHYLSQTKEAAEIEQINNHPQFKFETLEQNTMLEALDHFWNLHLKEMDHLREGIGLSAYGQKNPKHEYQKEGFGLFARMLDRLKESIVRTLCYGQLTRLEEYQAAMQEEHARRQEQIAKSKEEHGEQTSHAANDGIA
jgi:preprotein translocase subunit SecA